MSLRSFMARLRKKAPPPVIHSPWGIVSEEMRLQAAANMLLDPVKKMEVEEMLTRIMGSREAGLREARRRYPEAYS